MICRRDSPARSRPARASRIASRRPKIVYPPDGALIDWDGEELPLEAVGGKRPLRWLVDGRPLPPALPRRPIYWQPEGWALSS